MSKIAFRAVMYTLPIHLLKFLISYKRHLETSLERVMELGEPIAQGFTRHSMRPCSKPPQQGSSVLCLQGLEFCGKIGESQATNKIEHSGDREQMSSRGVRGDNWVPGGTFRPRLVYSAREVVEGFRRQNMAGWWDVAGEGW
jgi:hypothetical protein